MSRANIPNLEILDPLSGRDPLWEMDPLPGLTFIDRPTSVFDPAPGVKVGCCGPNLRVVTLCENDLLRTGTGMFLHIRLRIRH